jgi:uncharacterized protein (UPF0210 family)
MKIRTITTGISLKSSEDASDRIEPVAEFNRKAKEFFEQQEFEVQTTRIATNSWEEYLASSNSEEILSEVGKTEQICKDLQVSFFNVGYTRRPENIEICSDIIKDTSVISCSAKIGDAETGIQFENVAAAAGAIKRISEQTENGEGNFRFCAWANCKPGIPFFPAAYHQGETSFSIGLECSDMLMQAFSESVDLRDAEENLRSIVESELEKVQNIAQQISLELRIRFKGIDASLAPSLERDESIAFAYEKLGIDKFGQPGTLAISAIITRILKNLSIKTCGYSGLMLPVCEDFGLAQRAGEGAYNLTDLLLYSTICGCGLDVVPLPGDISIDKLESILLDMATLAIKLDKPLSARLLPAPGKKAGEMTTFNSPYLVNCRVFSVE